MRCAYCGRSVSMKGCPPAERVWCSAACSNVWDEAHPEEAAAWVSVENMTDIQRAELLAMLGFGFRC